MAIYQPLTSKASVLYRERLALSKHNGGLSSLIHRYIGRWYFSWCHNAEVSRQLRARTSGSRDVWISDGYDREIVGKVCGAIQAACGWPNQWFIPDDPIEVLFDPSFDDLDSVEFVYEYEHRLGVAPQESLLMNAITLGELVKLATAAVANSKHS